MSVIKVKDWIPDDRPREKLLKNGASALTNTELIAILLRSGTRSETVLDVAKRILAMAKNNLHELGKLEIPQLCKIRGIGATKAITLIAALELGRRRAAILPDNQPIIETSRDVAALFVPLLSDLPHEEFYALFLNAAGRLIGQVKLSQGGISGTVVDTRIILKTALEKLATKIVLIHNHPSGSINPSAEDRQITKKIKDAAALMDIQLIDHLIIAQGKYYSFAEHGAELQNT